MSRCLGGWMKGFNAMRILSFFAVAASVLIIEGCERGTVQKLDLKTEYQAVLLDNGQAYFGKLEQTGPEFIRLKEVYYIQTRVDQDTKEARSILLKRGVQEWHAPDIMDINKKHVVIIEPVGQNSKVAALINESKAKEVAK